MQRPQPTKSRAERHATRNVLAALLVFVTLASAVPPDAVFASVCCESMGGAMKDSCPLMRLKGVLQKQLAHSESSCHAGMEMPPSGEAAHDAPPELFPATDGDAAQHDHHQAVEHRHHHNASSHDAATEATQAKESSVAAAVSKPCSPDGCCQTGSLARRQRPRDEAAISNGFRPRTPTPAAAQRRARADLKHDSDARRLSPARAPPASL